MRANERRSEIMKVLYRSSDPVSAKELAAMFDVSRQAIVKDIAEIRVSVPAIMSTYRGYVLQKSTRCTREFKVRHRDDQAEKEMKIIVDLGGSVKNVSISHRAYGRISAELNIDSRHDAAEFLNTIRNSRSTLLGNSTSGYHYHLVEAASEERLDQIEDALRDAGFLAPLLTWEQENTEQEKKNDYT